MHKGWQEILQECKEIEEECMLFIIISSTGELRKKMLNKLVISALLLDITPLLFCTW